MLLRDAEPGDEREVAEVHVRSWKRAYRGLIPDDYLDELSAEDRIAGYRFDASDPAVPSTVLAVVEGAIGGFATFGPSRDHDVPDAGELYALYVDPLRWSRGTGRALLAEARRRLHARGFQDARLWLLLGNDQGERFYRADRWEPDGARRMEDPWGVLSEVVRYRRALP
jgi:GNAT superfamily N-acetyltransferase